MEYSNLRVPAMVNRLSNTTPRERPSFPKMNYSSSTTDSHTHNNNQPFSYTNSSSSNNRTRLGSSGSPERNVGPNYSSMSTLERKNGKLPKEIIYAQVVVSDTDQNGGSGPGRNGVHKRTIHTTFNGNSHTEPRSQIHHVPIGLTTSTTKVISEDPQIIEHFVYKQNSNKENLRMQGNYNPGGGYTSEYMRPKNVTTVLINNNEDDNYNIKSAASRTNELFSSYHHRSTTPEPERPFFYGDSRGINLQNSNSSSSPGYYQFDSSRSVSPVMTNVNSAKLVREADKNRDTFVSSAKLVNTFSPYNGGSSGHATHTDYSYMTSKLGSGNLKNETRTSTGTSKFRSQSNNIHDHGHNHNHVSSYTNNNTSNKYNSTGLSNRTMSEDVVDKKTFHSTNSMDRSRPTQVKSRSPPKNGFSNHANSLEKIYNNNNNKSSGIGPGLKEEKKAEKTSSGGGLISTLLRRNKDKKQQQQQSGNTKVGKDKEKKAMQDDLINDEDKDKEGKIKRQRAKFLSVFLEKNFTSKKNKTDSSKKSSNDTLNRLNKQNANNKQITDSDIEEVERRRDGEYHSWSSGDDFYRFQSRQQQQQQQQGKLNRGYSYNFGDYKKESEISAYDHEDSDYRRNMAIPQRYTSVTLGRPTGHPPKSQDYDSIAFRSKSLDRRALRNNQNQNTITGGVPKIIVTPNSPPVQMNANEKWNSSYEIHNNSRKQQESEWPRKEFSNKSKSTMELGGHQRSNGNLRYFGDTDMEDMSTYGRSRMDQSYETSTLNSRPSTKLQSNLQQYQNGYNVQRNGKHVSRKDNASQLRFQKAGGPLTLTRNSSESDNDRSASSQRSVYLHAPAVASIPTTLPKRTLSRDEISNYSGHQKQTRHLARSLSVLSPWRPRHYQEKYELYYNPNNGLRSDGSANRPPRLPRSPVQKSVSPAPGRESSSKDSNKLSQTQFIKTNNKPSPIIEKNSKNATNISRSKSMPKNSRLGWFSRRKNGPGDTGAIK